MAFTVRCPSCDKAVRFAETDAGATALCPACGARVGVPHPPLLGEAGAGDDGFGAPNPASESAFAAASVPDAGDTAVALQAQRAERFARGDRADDPDGDGGGRAPVAREKLYGSDAAVSVTHEDLKGLVFQDKAGGGR